MKTLLEFLNESLDINESISSIFTGKYTTKEFIEKINEMLNKGIQVKYEPYKKILNRDEETIKHFIDIEIFTNDYIISRDGTKESYGQKAKSINQKYLKDTRTAEDLKHKFNEYVKNRNLTDERKGQIAVIAYTITLLVPIALINEETKDKSSMKNVKIPINIIYYGSSYTFAEGVNSEDKIDKKLIDTVISPLKRFFRDPEGRKDDIEYNDKIKNMDVILNNFGECCPEELRSKILSLK